MDLCLPTGWTTEPLRSPDDERFLVITAPDGNAKVWVTVDFDTRQFVAGCTSYGTPPVSLAYEGRGWRKRLVNDAVKYLQHVIGKAG